MNPRRSASVGALPRKKKHFVSRNESGSGMSLDVRCACQYFQCDSLLPERANPVESRPTSKLGFHGEQGGVTEHEHLQQLQQFQPMNTGANVQVDQLSTHSFNVGGHYHKDVDRLSMRSVGAQRSLEQSTAQVDLSFVEKYPELEETARSRGLVVRSISDANESEMGSGQSTLAAGRRSRQMSVGGLSSGGGMRDPDTWSMRSGVSVRRISRSPSKADLFVADINIPVTHYDRRDQRSASASRRTSNADLSHSASHQATSTPMHVAAIMAPPIQQQQKQHQQLVAPQLNLIAPTPSPTTADMQLDFERAIARQRSPSPTTADYRIARSPVSTDYMRPDENKENIPYYQPMGDLMPQHRPIDVSKYTSNIYDSYTVQAQNTTTTSINTPAINVPPTTALTQLKPIDPLRQVVAELEQVAATRNIEDVCDNIKLKTVRPPSQAGEIHPPPLHLDEETKIKIVSSVPVVDIDRLVQSETEKATEAKRRSRSPTPKRARSPSPRRPPHHPPEPAHQTDNLQLSSLEPRVSFALTSTQIEQQQYMPDRNISPDRSKFAAPAAQHLQLQSIEICTMNINDVIPLQEASAEAKSTYASRIKSMFSLKNSSDVVAHEMSPKRQVSPPSKRQNSPSPKPQKLPSPKLKREKSPSPAPAPAPIKLVSMLSKPKPTPMSIMSGNTALITKPSEKEAMAVKVTETFSLKVDEMDQYCSRPPKPTLPVNATSATPPATMYSSREDFSVAEHASVDIADAFTPVVIPSVRTNTFMAGNRMLYSSEIDVQSRRSDSELNRGSKEPWMGGGTHNRTPKGMLISVPINIDSDSKAGGLGPNFPSGTTSQRSLPRAPSEQRVGKSKLARKSSFLDGRTQSQDRARLAGSHEDLYSTRMTKTVSFNFDERKSRLSEFENTTLSQQQREQKDFLERTYFARDHEYEPIGTPADDARSTLAKEPSPAPPPSTPAVPALTEKSKLAMDIGQLHDEMRDAEELQKDLEERYLSSEATTPRTESRTDNEIHTSQVDSSALEELPLKPENRRKGFMASAQDRTRKMQAGFKNQAGKIKTKLRSPPKKPPSGSPKAKERKRFKAPEFSKMKMPEIKRPDMSKLKDFKRPEFTKFNKPDMSKFKLPEKFSTLKLRRSKSFKENETAPDAEMSGVTAESGAVIAETQPQKKLFEFNFGTYPRAFRKKKKPLEPQSSLGTETGTEGLSVIPSTETQPSVESSSSPQGDRGPGPVRSRWADKFSDVSYNDSEGSQYRRYGSEQESFDRESSLERRMKADLEETESEAQSLGIMGGVADTKQFADFDEENRAIHEISKLRAGEFKRRPMVHQDSDLRSEDSKEAVGWTDKEVEKNKLLLKAELEAEAGYLKYPSEEVIAQETLSTASSGKKVVMEEIDDDEFFLRKRGISEDNIELRQYISNAIREGYDMPVNTLQRVGQSNEPIEYGDYDIPPPKPRRLHKSYQPDDVSQELESQRSECGDDLSVSQNGSDFFGAPKRPLRRGRGRSKYSMDSQDIQMTDDHMRHEQYFDDDEEYLRPPRNVYKDDDGDTSMNDLDFGAKQVFPAEPDEADEGVARPQPPRRRKRNQRETSMDKDSYVNGFSGRSVSNSYLQPPEDVIVYRTEHEYPIPLATPERYTDGASADSRKSLSAPRFDEDDRTSRGADSLAMDNNTKPQLNDEPDDVQEKFIIDMMENDGYAVVRKDHIPKPTPPARRKKFSRSPGERFATTPNVRTKRSTPPPARPPPPRGYTPSTEEEPVPPRRKSATSFEATSQNYEDDYEEPGALDQERPESPRNLQSGEVINKMKYRPLPPPPRPPREKQQRGDAKGLLLTGGDKNLSDTYDERIATSSTADSYDPTDVDLEEECIRFPEVEVSTQTDPLPDDFVCEEFVITDDMKVIEPRAFSATKKTLDELLREEEQKVAAEKSTRPLTEDEQLAHGLQRFRDANQRSLSERSRASSQADRSKSLSRPQTPSAVVIERRVSTPIPSQQSEIMLEAALIVRPIDDLDLEEEALRREGLLTDSSQHSKSDAESRYQGEEVEVSTKEEEERGSKPATSDYSLGPSTEDLNIALEELKAQDESVNGNEIRTETVEDMEEEQLVEEVERTMRDYGYEEDTTAPNKQYYQAEPEDVIDSEHKWSEERELVHTRGADIHRETAIAASETKASLKAQKPPRVQSETEEGVQDDQVKYEYERRTSEEDRQEPATKLTENNEADTLFEEPPLPPPRRKSTSGIETAPTLAVMEQPPREVTPVQSVAHTEQPRSQLPTRVSDFEVERLSVHALQAGQIMVSQLHGAQISADELECKAGNLVVKNIELPPGFIEGIVERVQRNADRSSLLSVETQTSRQASSEALSGDEQPTKAVKDVIPPPKPPRQRDLESAKPVLAATTTAEVPDEPALQQLRNFDEETQTEPTTSPMAAAPGLPPVYATADYLHSLGPMAFYNLQRSEEAAEEVRAYDRRHPHHHHHHHHHRRCDSSSSELDEASAQHDKQEQERPRSRSRSCRSRSSTHPPVESPQTVVKAGRQFLSACGLSLVHIINQLTDCVRGGTDDADKDNETRLRKVPTLVVLFVVITFGLLLFLLSGKSVHTHHWDYFNPPSNEGRPS